MRTFRSKIDKSYHVIIWVLLALVIYLFWAKVMIWAFVTLVISVFALESFFKTEYTILSEGVLYIRSGFFPKFKVDISSIELVKYVEDFTPAYALSVKRFMIKTPTQTYYVSPENRKEFIKCLSRYNKEMKVII